jgi:peptide/nickel transport system substrate-binding protein
VKRTLGFAAVVALAAAAISGCASLGGQAKLVAGSSLVIGEAGTFVSINPGVYAPTGSQQALADLAVLTRPSFYTHDASGGLVENTNFGSVSRASDNTVTYTLTGKAKWSDGVPVDAADLVVSWLAATDPQLPGFAGSLRQTSLALSDKLTLLTNGVKIHFTQAVPDWKTALPVTVPAHLLGKLAQPTANLTDAAAEKFITDRIGGDGTSSEFGAVSTAFASAFNPVADGSNTGLAANLLISAGAYQIESASAASVVLKANPNFGAGPAATVAKVTINGYDGQASLVQALAAKKVDLAAPQASTMFSLTQAEDQAKSGGLHTLVGDSGQNEVALLNYGAGSAFNSGTWQGNAKQLLAARLGVFKFMPRAGIWTVLAGTAGISKTNSLVLSNKDGNYQATTNQNGTSAFAFQNAESSAEGWQAAGFGRTIPLRVLFDANSSRGQLEYTEFSKLGKLGGFDVQSVSSNNPAAVLASGQWDVYITNLPRLNSDLTALATAVGSLTGFHSDAASAIVAKVAAGGAVAGSTSDQLALDKALVAGYYGLPLFQLDNLVVWSDKLQGYSGKPANQSVAWGYSNWSVSGQGN